jgi:hypothetical protein
MKRIARRRSAWSLAPPRAEGFFGWLHEEAIAVSDLVSGVGSTAPSSSPSDILGQASMYVMVPFLDATVAQACLLQGVELATPAWVPAGKHPVLYSFGFHRGVRPRYLDPSQGVDYNETIVGIPWVVFREPDGSTSGPYFQFVSIRLDNYWAEWLGLALGFPKQLAFFDVSDTTYSFSMQPGANPVMSGTFGPPGATFGPDFPNFQTIEPSLMQQPVISRMPDGVYILTSFQFDRPDSSMFAAEADFTIADNSLTGLPASVYDFPGLDVTAFGGCFHGVYNWVMSQASQVLL